MIRWVVLDCTAGGCPKMNPLEHLEMEHKLIRRAVKAITKRRNQLHEDEQLSEDIFWGIIDFMSTYGDIVHHIKEERILFRYIERLSVSPEIAQTISELVDDHTQLLSYVAGLRRAARDYLAGVPAAKQRVTNYLTAYIELMEPHVKCEDTELFPSLRQLLNTAAMKQLAKEFKDFDAKMMPKVHETYEYLVRKLEK